MALPPGLSWDKRLRTYRVQYKRPDGTWARKVVGKELELALTERARLRDQVVGHESRRLGRNEAKLRECVDGWLESQYARNKPQTVKWVETHARCLVRHFGDIHVKHVRAREVDRFVGARRREGVKSNTINGDLRVLRAILRHARAAGLIQELPCKIKMLRAPKRKIVELFTPDEIGCVLDCAEPRVRALLVISATSALRLDEILHLRWDDVDLREALVYVREKMYEHRRLDGALVEKHWSPKSHQARTVSIPLEAVDELRRYRMRQKWSTEGDWVFQSQRPRQRWTNPFKAIRASFKAAGLYERGRGTHAIRHTVATRMLQNGIDLETVREVLGHESVTTTELYLHTTSERKRTAAQAGSLLNR